MDIKAEREKERERVYVFFSNTDNKTLPQTEIQLLYTSIRAASISSDNFKRKSVFDSLLIQMLHVKESLQYFQTSVTQGKQLK